MMGRWNLKQSPDRAFWAWTEVKIETISSFWSLHGAISCPSPGHSSHRSITGGSSRLFQVTPPSRQTCTPVPRMGSPLPSPVRAPMGLPCSPPGPPNSSSHRHDRSVAACGPCCDVCVCHPPLSARQLQGLLDHSPPLRAALHPGKGFGLEGRDGANALQASRSIQCS